ncbi:MAG: histidine kinase [Hyphomicrobiales bacterium]|nr:histidine kinase [Hyphomicrobiales bacterium]
MNLQSGLNARHREKVRPAFSARAYLLALVLALVIPGLIFTGYVLMRFASAERARIEEQVQTEARNLSGALDRRIAGLIEALRVLAASSDFENADLDEFHKRATEAREIVGRNIVLRGASGQQLVNARIPRGAELPRLVLPADQRALAERRTVVSDVFQSPLGGQRMVAIIAPIIRANEPAYLLSLALELQDVRSALSEMGVPGDHVATIFDGRGVLIARSRDHARYAGASEPQAVWKAQSGVTSGVESGFELDGAPVLRAWNTSALTNWTVTASVPRETVDTPVRQALLALASVGGFTLLASGVLAWSVSGRISGALRELSSAGAELGARRAVPPIHTPLADANAIGEALTGAGRRLQEYEARLEKALAAARMFSFEWTRHDDAISRSASAAALLGMPASVVQYGSRAEFRARIHPQDQERFSRMAGEATLEHPEYRVEYRYLKPDGELVWMETSGFAEFGPSGEVLRVTGFTADVTARKQAEIRQSLLMRELHHRVKNNLATVLAVANLSGRNATSLDDYKRKLRERIQSMARSHTLLTENAFQRAPLSRVLANELEAYGDAAGERVQMEGPDIELPAEAAVALGMAFHELATNAGKYGSLSHEGGRLIVTWTVESQPGQKRLRIVWRECDGPPVVPPERSGFGSRLLESVIGGQLRGQVEMHFEPKGLVATIEALLDQADSPQADPEKVA